MIKKTHFGFLGNLTRDLCDTRRYLSISAPSPSLCTLNSYCWAMFDYFTIEMTSVVAILIVWVVVVITLITTHWQIHGHIEFVEFYEFMEYYLIEFRTCYHSMLIVIAITTTFPSFIKFHDEKCHSVRKSWLKYSKEYTQFYKQLDFSSQPGVASEILEIEAESCLAADPK